MKHLCCAQICSNTSSQCNVLATTRIELLFSTLPDIQSGGTHIISQPLDFNFALRRQSQLYQKTLFTQLHRVAKAQRSGQHSLHTQLVPLHIEGRLVKGAA